LPVGTDGHGVRIVQRGRPARLVVLLSAKRYRTVARHQVEVDCSHAPHVTLGGGSTTHDSHEFTRAPHPTGSASVVVRTPRRRGPIATRISLGWDYCVVSVTRSDGPDTTLTSSLALIPLTQAGADFADESRIASDVITSGDLLQSSGPHALRVQDLARRMRAVVLASPAQPPPPEKLGLYSDGAAHVYAAQRDHRGTLLFLEKDGELTRTNLLRYLQHPSLLWGTDG
jgi:hypothetical protein